MEIEKNERINALFEFYGPLLTKKQHDYLQLYYGEDFSLGEIADEFNVSRQAVFDNIKRTEKILAEYEEKLHLDSEFKARNEALSSLQAYFVDKRIDPELRKKLDKLTELIEQG